MPITAKSRDGLSKRCMYTHTLIVCLSNRSLACYNKHSKKHVRVYSPVSVFRKRGKPHGNRDAC